VKSAAANAHDDTMDLDEEAPDQSEDSPGSTQPSCSDSIVLSLIDRCFGFLKFRSEQKTKVANCVAKDSENLDRGDRKGIWKIWVQ
jgi:hypothetical protein